MGFQAGTKDGPKPACNADMCETCADMAKRENAERRALARMKRVASKCRNSVIFWKGSL